MWCKETGNWARKWRQGNSKTWSTHGLNLGYHFKIKSLSNLSFDCFFIYWHFSFLISYVASLCWLLDKATMVHKSFMNINALQIHFLVFAGGCTPDDECNKETGVCEFWAKDSVPDWFFCRMFHENSKWDLQTGKCPYIWKAPLTVFDLENFTQMRNSLLGKFRYFLHFHNSGYTSTVMKNSTCLFGIFVITC